MIDTNKLVINTISKISLFVMSFFSLLSCDGSENISTSTYIEMNKLYFYDNSQENLFTYEN